MGNETSITMSTSGAECWIPNMIPHEKEERLFREIMLDSRAEFQKIQDEPGISVGVKKQGSSHRKDGGYILKGNHRTWLLDTSGTM